MAYPAALQGPLPTTFRVADRSRGAYGGALSRRLPGGLCAPSTPASSPTAGFRLTSPGPFGGPVSATRHPDERPGALANLSDPRLHCFAAPVSLLLRFLPVVLRRPGGLTRPGPLSGLYRAHRVDPRWSGRGRVSTSGSRRVRRVFSVPVRDRSLPAPRSNDPDSLPSSNYSPLVPASRTGRR